MKSTKLLFACGLVGTIAFSIAFYRLSNFLTLETAHYFVFALVLLTMVVSTIFYFKRLRDELKGIPVDDEFSIALSKNAARNSFPYSYGLWVTILVFTMFHGQNVIPIGVGIAGMALIYGFFWLYYRNKGLSND